MEEEESSGQQAQQAPRRQQRAFVPLRSRNWLIHHCRLNQIAASGRSGERRPLRWYGVEQVSRDPYCRTAYLSWLAQRRAGSTLLRDHSVWKPHVKVVSVKWASCKTFVFLPVGAAMSYHFFIWSNRLIIREKKRHFLKLLRASIPQLTG